MYRVRITARTGDQYTQHYSTSAQEYHYQTKEAVLADLPILMVVPRLQSVEIYAEER